MSGKCFLDTNIFVYSFDLSAPEKNKRATELIAQAVRTRTGIVSYQVVQEFLNVALRRFAKPMTTAEAEQFVTTTFRPLLTIHSSFGLFGEALRIAGRFRLSWFDALIVASAIEAECDVLYSEDLQNGQRFESVQVVNPFS
jgi:predicted nucleic acid-binding protein